MTVRTVVKLTDPAFVWLDVVNPDKAELADMAERYGLHFTSMKDCLDPEHLPKFEAFDSYTFLILRAWDEDAPPNCTTVQEATRKVAIFLGSSFLITVHRKEQRWLSALETRFSGKVPEKPALHILSQLLNSAADTYLPPMEEVEARLDAFEQKVFVERTIGSRHFRGDLREIHLAKRQVTLTRRLLWRTLEVVHRLMPTVRRALPLFRDVQENVESYHFYADELLDEANTLLGVQLSLASHRSGEVMRVLTLFSVFFLPLTFIVGVYGMNFVHMPELHTRWGYPVVLAVMGGVTGGIYLWFRRRGWMRE